MWEWIRGVASRLWRAIARAFTREQAIDDWKKEAQLELAKCFFMLRLGAAGLEETEENLVRYLIDEAGKRIAGLDWLEAARREARHAPLDALELGLIRAAISRWKVRFESVTLGEAFVESHENMELAREARAAFGGLADGTRDLFVRFGGDPAKLARYNIPDPKPPEEPKDST